MNIAELKEARQSFAADAPTPEVNTGVQGKKDKVATKNSSTVDEIKKINKEKEDVQAKSLKLTQDTFDQSKKQTKLLESQLEASKQQAMSMQQLNTAMMDMLKIMRKPEKLSAKRQDFAANDSVHEIHGQAKGDLFGDIGSMLGDLMGGFGRRRGGYYGRGRDKKGPTRRPKGGGGGSARNRRNRRRTPTPNVRGRYNLKDVMKSAKTKVGNTASRATGAIKDTASRGVDAAKGAARYGAGKVKAGASGVADAARRLPKGGKVGLAAAAVTGVGTLAYNMFSGSPDVPEVPKVNSTVTEFDRYIEAQALAQHGGKIKPAPITVNDGVVRQQPNEPYLAGDDVRVPDTVTVPPVELGTSTEKPAGLRASSITQTGMDASDLKFGTEMMSAAELKAFLSSDQGKHFGVKADDSASFIASYGTVAKNRADEMKEAQKKYLHESAYMPQLAKASTVTGVDLGVRGSAVQEMLYANGRRYGAADNSVAAALKGKDVKAMTDADIIKVVYDYKMNIVPKKFAEMKTQERSAMQRELAEEGAKLLTQAGTDSLSPSGMKHKAMASTRNVSPSSAMSMMSAAPAALNTALSGYNAMIATFAASMGITPGAGSSSSSSAESPPGTAGANKDEAAVADPKAGALYVLGQKHVVLNHGRVNMSGLHSNFKKAFYTMVGDWVTNFSGTKVYVESAFRTRAEQERLWIKYGKNTKRVARPGTSRHESGFAIDIDRKSAAALESSGLFSKYGFHRPLKHEPWHVEMTAAGRNKPVEPEVNVSPTSMPTESGESTKVDQPTATPNTGIPSTEADPNAVSETAIGASSAGATTAVVAAAAVGAGVIAGSTDEAGVAVDAGNMTTKDKAGVEKAKADKAKVKADAAKTGTTKGVTKGIGRTAAKATPVVGTVLTAAEAVSIVTDDEMTGKEKAKAGTELAGGVAGAAAGGKLGAAAGGAAGAAFFGVGAVPGAFIGGIIGSVAGYMAGSYGAGEAFDTVAGDDVAKPEAKAEDVAAPAAVEPVVESVKPVVKPDGTVTVEPVVKAPKAKPKSEVSSKVPTAAASSLVASSASAAVPAVPAAELAGLPDLQQAMAAAEHMSTADLKAISDITSYMSGAVEVPDITNGFAPTTQAKAATTPVQIPAPVGSPANQSYYSGDDISVQPKVQTKPSPITQTAAQPVVTRTETSQEKIERQQYEPIKQVMALEPTRQDTMMPERFQPGAPRTPSRGMSESNSSRQTIDECPSVIADGGLIFIQTGYI